VNHDFNSNATVVLKHVARKMQRFCDNGMRQIKDPKWEAKLKDRGPLWAVIRWNSACTLL
jgi:hypothetical protein